MAGGQERILRGRIKSVQATKKITRAMELIAASRIVKAQQRVVAAVPYSDMITEVVRDLSAAGSAKSMPLLAGRETVKNVCYVVLTADKKSESARETANAASPATIAPCTRASLESGLIGARPL